MNEPDPEISVTPSALAFGDVTIGYTRDHSFTVRNTGGGTLNGSASISATSFSIVGSSSYSLSAGQSTTITVRFSPSSMTSYSGTANFTGGGGASRGVSGTGTDGAADPIPTISVSPASRNFGTVIVGQSKNMTFTVTNIGAGTLNGSAFINDLGYTIVGDETYSLAGGQSRNITVMFAPKAETTHSGTVIFTGGSNATQPVTGVGGSAGTPDITVSPSPLDFGAVMPGAQLDKNFTVTNTGTATLTGTLSLTGSSAFTSPPPPPVPIPPAEYATGPMYEMWSAASSFSRTAFTLANGRMVGVQGSNANTQSFIQVSDDNGQTWTKKFTTTRDYAVMVRHSVAPDGTIYVAFSPNRLTRSSSSTIYRSTDNGNTWQAFKSWLSSDTYRSN